MSGKYEMAPLWLMYPEIPQGSIGWRMGYGENYAMDFYSWFYSLTREQKKEYDTKFPKPICWEQGLNEIQFISGGTMARRTAKLARNV